MYHSRYQVSVVYLQKKAAAGSHSNTSTNSDKTDGAGKDKQAKPMVNGESRSNTIVETSNCTYLERCTAMFVIFVVIIK